MLNKLEIKGLENLLLKITILLVRYNQVIGNGDTCNMCCVHGLRIPIEHKPDCQGKKLYNETIEAIEILRSKND